MNSGRFQTRLWNSHNSCCGEWKVIFVVSALKTSMLNCVKYFSIVINIIITYIFFPKTDRSVFWNYLLCLNGENYMSYVLNKDGLKNNEENKNTHSSKVLLSHTAQGHIWSHSGLCWCDCIDFIKLYPLYKHKWIHK